MVYNVLEFLENSCARLPYKAAVKDENKCLTYSELRTESMKIGSALCGMISPRRPVGIYMEKSADTLCAFFGVLYAGGCYSLFNPELPQSRLSQIFDVLKPELIITDDSLMAAAEQAFSGAKIVNIRDLTDSPICAQALYAVRDGVVDTDPLYINFTSGSTGIPKGIVVGHRSTIDFIDCFTDIFKIGEDDIIANQAPFDFDVSVKDIYSAIKTGATLVIVPRHLFSAPVQLTDYLCDNRITTMIWAVSALCLISTFHCLDYKTPSTVNKILFSGEVMPYKHLREFQRHLPDALYVNLYGPTEITCNCTYHILEKDRDYSEGIPIGRHFPNEDVFLLSDSDSLVTEAESVGEICVRGSSLALGYYYAPEQNAQHFTDNPLNTAYPEKIYRSGDLARYNAFDELVFCGRKDFQIKYMGHRIELEEVERAMSAISGVERCCCVFDERRSRLKGYYIGEIEKDRLHTLMEESLPAFMIPGILRRVEEMPLTKNGKIDRKRLEETAGGKRS